MEPKYKSSHKKSFGRLFSTVVLIALSASAFWQRQNILDWWMLRSYDPPISVVQLATQADMTPLARKVFYLQKPQIQEKDAFYISCEENDTTIVLGCYKPRDAIYVLKVTDPRLEGIQQVTAGHEMLHAAYDRLGYSQKEKINELVNEAYRSVTDETLRAKIDQYKQANADIPNELHSILGTEVPKLPSDLEAYYQRYFTNRQAIVAYAAKYQSEFSSRKARVASMDKELKEIEAQVTANNAELDKEQATILAESARLDSIRSSGLIDEYNQGVANYNASLVPFRAKINATKTLVNRYKEILAERNKVAEEAQTLERALDSRRIDTTVEDI